jgi:hypothetical protein
MNPTTKSFLPLPTPGLSSELTTGAPNGSNGENGTEKGKKIVRENALKRQEARKNTPREIQLTSSTKAKDNTKLVKTSRVTAMQQMSGKPSSQLLNADAIAHAQMPTIATQPLGGEDPPDNYLLLRKPLGDAACKLLDKEKGKPGAGPLSYFAKAGAEETTLLSIRHNLLRYSEAKGNCSEVKIWLACWDLAGNRAAKPDKTLKKEIKEFFGAAEHETPPKDLPKELVNAGESLLSAGKSDDLTQLKETFHAALQKMLSDMDSRDSGLRKTWIEFTDRELASETSVLALCCRLRRSSDPRLLHAFVEAGKSPELRAKLLASAIKNETVSEWTVFLCCWDAWHQIERDRTINNDSILNLKLAYNRLPKGDGAINAKTDPANVNPQEIKALTTLVTTGTWDTDAQSVAFNI